MSIRDEINKRLRAITKRERQTKDVHEANAARLDVWQDYIEHCYQNPMPIRMVELAEAMALFPCSEAG